MTYICKSGIRCEKYGDLCCVDCKELENCKIPCVYVSEPVCNMKKEKPTTEVTD